MLETSLAGQCRGAAMDITDDQHQQSRVRRLLPVLFGAVLVLALLAQWAGALGGLERVLLDFKKRAHAGADPIEAVVVIAIDESSLTAVREVYRMAWPWPREFHALVLDYLAGAGAKRVVFDLLLDTADRDRVDIDSAGSDQRFGEALANTGIGVLAAHLEPAAACLPELNKVSPGRVVPVLPLPRFAQAAAAVADARVVPDRDGVLRRVPLLGCGPDGKPRLALSVQAALAPAAADIEVAAGEATAMIAGQTIPVKPAPQMELRWYRNRSDTQRPFRMLRYSDVLTAAVARLGGREADTVWPDDLFDGAIVMIGATAAGLADVKSTPTGAGASGQLPLTGVEVHATAVTNLLAGQHVRHLPAAWVAGVLIVVLLLTALGATQGHSLIALGSALALAIAVDLIAHALFRWAGIVLPSGLLMTACIAMAVAVVSTRYVLERKQRQFIRNAFGRYVQGEVIAQIMRDPGQLELGGQQRELSVMFSDLAGFTSMSEAMTPHELVAFMNEYLGAMSDVIIETGGTLDKYIGDAIMAVWGAPVEQADHAKRACRAVVRQQQTLARLHEEWAARGKPTPSARFGVHSGEMVVGNVGGRQRFDYTVLGDNVNLGARLEPINSQYGTHAMISQATFDQLDGEFVCRELDRIVVKGRSQPVTVLELLDEAPNEALAAFAAQFAECLALYYDQQWTAASAAFEAFGADYPEDTASALFIRRCAEYTRQPPPEDWNGAYVYTSKS